MTLGDKISLVRKIVVENCGNASSEAASFITASQGVTFSKAMTIRFTIRSVPLPKHRVQSKSLAAAYRFGCEIHCPILCTWFSKIPVHTS